MQPTPEQLQLVAEFQALTEQERRIYLRSLFADNPQEFLRQLNPDDAYAIQNGAVGQIFGSVLLTGLTGGLWAGVAAFVAGSAQLILSPRQNQNQQRRDPIYNNSYTGSIGNTLAKIGDPIPAIFCSRTLDPTGGVQTQGLVVHNRVETLNGTQIAYTLFALSHGQIGNVDLSLTLINGQPISNFSASDIVLGWKDGSIAQTGFPNYQFYAQNIQPKDNGGAGIGLITSQTTGTSSVTATNAANFVIGGVYQFAGSGGTFTLLAVIGNKLVYSGSITAASGVNIVAVIVSGVTVGTVTGVTTAASQADSSFLVPTTEFQSYGSGKQFLVISAGSASSFKTLSRTVVSANIGSGQQDYYFIETDYGFGWPGGSVYSYDKSIYRTTKRVNQIDLNLALQVWAKDSNGESIDFATIYLVSIRQFGAGVFTNIAEIAVRSKNPNTVLRGLVINNLPLAVYDVQIVPLLSFSGTISAYEILDWGAVNTFGTGFGNIRIQGYQIAAGFQTGFASLASIAKTRTPDNSGSRGVTLQISSVNEIEYIASSGVTKNRDCDYKGIAIGAAKITFSEKLSQGVSVTWFIDEGILTHQLLLVGTADSGSSTGTLNYLPGFAGQTLPNLVVRNTTKRAEATVTAIAGSTITAPGLLIEEGDTFILKKSHSTCWWPEIDTWLAYNSKFGISRQVCADYYMDWVSMTEATRWVEGANQFNQKFAWHGIIEGKTGYAELCLNNSNEVLLQPWNGRGKKGYLPVKSMPTTALFTEANATSFKRTRTNIDFQTPTELVLTYREQETFNSINPSLTNDPIALSYYDQSITIRSWARWRDQVPLYQESAKLMHCTSRAQATLTAKIQFNRKRYAGRIASQLNAKTIESISLKLGEYYRVLTAATQYQLERSGMVIEVVAGEFRLDRDFTICDGISQGGIGGLTDGTKDFTLAGVSAGDIVLNIESNVFSIISSVGVKTLVCAPPIPADTHYRIYDLSSTNMALFVYGQTVDAPVSAFSWRVDANGHYWYSIPSVPNVGDIVLIGKNQNYDRLFQSVAITRSVRQEDDKIGEASIEIVGTNITPELFVFDDLVVTNRNEDINTPP